MVGGEGALDRSGVSRYTFQMTESVPLQIDGEVKSLTARMPVVVESAHRALATLG